jgi:hypothetical protein
MLNMALNYAPYTLGELTRLYERICLCLRIADLSSNSIYLYVVGRITGITCN